MEQAHKLIKGQIERFASQAKYERTLVSYYFTLEDDIPTHESSWILYCIKNREFLQNVRYLEANTRDAVLEGYNTRGRTMFKEKLYARLRKLASTHDFISHTTCLHLEPWDKPSYHPSHVCGNDHSDYTIVMHPWLVNHMRVYRLDERDLIEGMMFGNKDRYIAAAGHELWNHPRIPRRRTFNDYRGNHSDYLVGNGSLLPDRGANISIGGNCWLTGPGHNYVDR